MFPHSGLGSQHRAVGADLLRTLRGAILRVAGMSQHLATGRIREVELRCNGFPERRAVLAESSAACWQDESLRRPTPISVFFRSQFFPSVFLLIFGEMKSPRRS
jgi:hypothetical protein